MATIANDLKGILSLVFLMIILVTSTNIDCNGKPFHCMNTTHFLICVDLGNGISITIDDFVIPCPPMTFCQRTNRFECEFPMVSTTVYPLEVINANEGTTTAETFATLKETKLSDLSNDITDQTIIRNDLSGVIQDDTPVSKTIMFPNVTLGTAVSYQPTNDNSVKEATTTEGYILETIKEVIENIQIKSSTHESISVPNLYLDEQPFIENVLVKPDIKLSESDLVLEKNKKLIKNGAHTSLPSLEAAEQSNVLHAADLENISGQALNNTIIISDQNITRHIFQDTSLSLRNLTDMKIKVDEIVASNTNNETLLPVDSSINDIPNILNKTNILPSDSITMNDFDPLPSINEITLLNITIPSQHFSNVTHAISSIRQSNNSLIDLKDVFPLLSDGNKSTTASTTVTEQNVSNSITDTNETYILSTVENIIFKELNNGVYEELNEGLSPDTLSLKPTIPTESVTETTGTLAQNNKQRNISNVLIVADETIPLQNYTDINLQEDILSHSLNSRKQLNKTLQTIKTIDTFSLESTPEPPTMVHTFEIISNNESSTNTDPLKRQYEISIYDRLKPNSILAIESSTVTEPNTLINTTDATLSHNNEIQSNATDSGIKEPHNSNKSDSRHNYTDNNVPGVNNTNLNDDISLFNLNSLNFKSITTSEPNIVDTYSLDGVKLSDNTNTSNIVNDTLLSFPMPNKILVTEFMNITELIKTVNTSNPTLLPSNELQKNIEMLNSFNNTPLDLNNNSLQDKNNESGNTNSSVQLIEKKCVESNISNQFPIFITSTLSPDLSHSTNVEITTILSNSLLPNNKSLSQYNKNESMKGDITRNNNYTIKLNQSLNKANGALPEFGTKGESVKIVTTTEKTHVLNEEFRGFTRLVENLTIVEANTVSVGFTDATEQITTETTLGKTVLHNYKFTNNIDISTIANKIIHSNGDSLPDLNEGSSIKASEKVTVGSITTTERIKIVNTAYPNSANIPSNLNTNESVSLQNLNEEIDNIISDNITKNFPSLLNETILPVTTENILNQRSTITNEQSANNAYKSDNLEQTYTILNNYFIDNQTKDFLGQSTENIPNNNFLSIKKPTIRQHIIINATDLGLVHTNEVENTSIVLETDLPENKLLTNEKQTIQSSKVTTKSSLNISPIIAESFTTPLIEINVNHLGKNTTASDDELSIYENNTIANNIQNASYYVEPENLLKPSSDINVGEAQIVKSLPVYVASPQSNITSQIQNSKSKTDSLVRDTETSRSNVDKTEKRVSTTLVNTTLNKALMSGYDFVTDSKHDNNTLAQLYLTDHKIYDSNEKNNTLLISENTQSSQNVVNSSILFINSTMDKVKLGIGIDPLVTTEEYKIKLNALPVRKYDLGIDNKIVVNVSAAEEVPLVATNLSSIISNATNFTSVVYPLLQLTSNIKPLTENISRRVEIRTDPIDNNYNQEPKNRNKHYNYTVVNDMNKKERITVVATNNETVAMKSYYENKSSLSNVTHNLVMNETDAQRNTSIKIDMPHLTDVTGYSSNISSLSNNISDKIVLTKEFASIHDNFTRTLIFNSTEKTLINDKVGEDVLSTNSNLNQSFSLEAVIQTTPETVVVNAVPHILSEHTNINRDLEEQKPLYFKESLLEKSTENGPAKIKPENKVSSLNITYKELFKENKEIDNTTHGTRVSTALKGDLVTVDVFNISSKQVNSFADNQPAGLQHTIKQMGSPVDNLTAAKNNNYTSDKVSTTLIKFANISPIANNNNATDIEFKDYPQHNNDETKRNNFPFYTGRNASVLVVTDKLDKEHDKIVFTIAPHTNSNISDSAINTSAVTKNNIQNETLVSTNQLITTLTNINNRVDTVYPIINSTAVNHTISTSNNIKNITSIDDKHNRSITFLSDNLGSFGMQPGLKSTHDVIRSNKPYVSLLSLQNNTEYTEPAFETTNASNSPVNYNEITNTHVVINSSIFTTVQSLGNETIPRINENISEQIKSLDSSLTSNTDMITDKENNNSTLFKKTPESFITDNNQILRNATYNSTQTLLKNNTNAMLLLLKENKNQLFLPTNEKTTNHALNITIKSENYGKSNYRTNDTKTKIIVPIANITTSKFSHNTDNNNYKVKVVEMKSYIPKTNRSNTHIMNTIKYSTNFSCQNFNLGRYADNQDCTKFYVCIGRVQSVVGYCPTNTVFSDFNKQCTSNLSHCVRNNQFRCSQEGRFSDFFEDNTYYICVKNKKIFTRYKLKCQNGYHLNKTALKCELDEDLSHQSEESKSEDSQKSKESNGSRSKSKEEIYFDCPREGRFSDSEDCRKYYACVRNNKLQYRRKIKFCGSDEVFHREEQRCVDIESYECWSG